MSERMTDDDVVIAAMRLGMGKVTREQVLSLATVIRGETGATIKALADALEVAKRGCRQSGELEDSEWEQINSALRLAGHLP